MAYVQSRINFNADKEEDMRAYEHLESFGRKRTQYIIRLILADLEGKDIRSETFNPSEREVDKLKQSVSELENRVTVLEKRLGDSTHKVIAEQPSKQDDVENIDSYENEGDDFSSLENYAEDEVIPPDLAARLGSLGSF